MNLRASIRLLIVVIAGAVSGLVSVLAPYIATHGITTTYPSALFPLLGSAWEELTLISVALVLLAGGTLGFLSPKHWMLVGFSTAFAFPIVAILEMSQYPTSHNLWPFEFALYALLIAGPALVGAAIGSRIKRRYSHAT